MIDIKERRLELGLSLQEIADRVGVTKSTIFRWENNQSMMKKDKIKPLAFALSVPPAYLMDQEIIGPHVFSKILKRARELRNFSIDEVVEAINNTRDNAIEYTPSMILDIEKDTNLVPVHVEKHYINWLIGFIPPFLLDVVLNEPFESWGPYQLMFFGDANKYSGDDWITYIAKTLLEIAQEKKIDEDIINKLLEFLAPLYDTPYFEEAFNKIKSYTEFLISQYNNKAD